MTNNRMVTEIVSLKVKNGIAIVTIDNPPVNALSHAVRIRLCGTLDALQYDDRVKGVVIACAGRTFVAGADISEFDKPLQAPTLRDVIESLETLPKPSIAAIHGTALGGGLELALGCHYRVALDNSKLGLPEVKLGLIPGAGGTVRLPYLVGPHKALSMVASGEFVSTREALDMGLLDAVFDAGSSIVDQAAAFLLEALAGQPASPVRYRRDKVDNADLAAFDSAAAVIAKKARGLEAPIAAAGAIRDALTLPFEEALLNERATFDALMWGEQSEAQRYLFFAERTASKLEGVPSGMPTRNIETVGVIGAGTMGAGIAMSFANAGIPVTIVDIDEASLLRGRANIEKNYAISVVRGSLTQALASERLALISGSVTFAALANCDLVVEAAYEDMEVKKGIFGKLDAVVKPGAILGTNTSYLDVNEIASATSRPSDVLGLHFFSPANVMKLVEIVRGSTTSVEVLATALKLAKRLGKVPVVVGVCRGFVGNRMLGARSIDAIDLLLEGASPAEVDKAFVDFGWPMGPFQMQDLAGLDIGWRNRKSLGETEPIADDLCEMGRLGQKSGKGYYLYENGSRTPKSDLDVEELIAAKAMELGITRRKISAKEIIERSLYPMINEGALLLDEGIAARASDIDLVWIHGYGFPRGKGGPMFWAERHGLTDIVRRLKYWHEITGKAQYSPSRQLLEMAHPLGERVASQTPQLLNAGEPS